MYFGLGQILYLFTLNARDFSSAVSGFCHVFTRPMAEGVTACGQHRKFPLHARKPLVPRVLFVELGYVKQYHKQG